MSSLSDNIRASTQTIQSLAALEKEVGRAAEIITKCLLGGNKLLICGNGGSASDASHLATEFVGRFVSDRRSYPAIALTDSGGTLTSISNDYGFEQVFARQVRGLAKPGDVVMGISTSGQSRNVLLALEAARQVGAISIAFLGRGGGFTRGAADVELLVGSDVTARVQEAHLLLYHTICEMVDAELICREK